MTKIEFINTVKSELRGYPEDEIIKSLSFYTESIDDRMEDGMDEEKAVSELGDISDIIRNMKLTMPISVLAKTRIKESKEKSGNKTIWIILAIAGFPIWLPLSLAFAAVALAVYITIWALIAALFACEFAFGVSGAVCLVYSFIHMITVSWTGGTAIAGGSLFLLGLFVILLKPVINLSKALVKLTVSFVKQIKRLFIGKENK